MGSTYWEQFRILNIGSAPKTLQIRAVLPTGTYNVYAEARGEFSSGYMMITGTGATWENGGSWTQNDLNGMETCELMGTAVGGQQPAATLSFGGGASGDVLACVFKLIAVRVA